MSTMSGRVGQQVRAGRGLELDAGGDERVPAAREVGLGEAGLGDQVGAIQQRAGADVGRQRRELALRVGRLREGVADELAAQRARVVRRLVQVLEAARAGELADELEVDRHHVGQARAGGQRGGHRGVVVGVLQRDDLDVDVRMQRMPARQRGLRGAVEVGEGGDGDRRRGAGGRRRCGGRERERPEDGRHADREAGRAARGRTEDDAALADGSAAGHQNVVARVDAERARRHVLRLPGAERVLRVRLDAAVLDVLHEGVDVPLLGRLVAQAEVGARVGLLPVAVAEVEHAEPARRLVVEVDARRQLVAVGEAERVLVLRLHRARRRVRQAVAGDVQAAR